jgi:hypothetical protein
MNPAPNDIILKVLAAVMTPLIIAIPIVSCFVYKRTKLWGWLVIGSSTIVPSVVVFLISRGSPLLGVNSHEFILRGDAFALGEVLRLIQLLIGILWLSREISAKELRRDPD